VSSTRTSLNGFDVDSPTAVAVKLREWGISIVGAARCDSDFPMPRPFLLSN
jgi:hypothetical protein